MQTKSVSLHFMVFIRPPQRKPGENRKKKKKKRTETAGVKTPTKIFTAELRKFAKVIKNSQRTHITNSCSFPLINFIRVPHNCGRVTSCVRTLHRVNLLTFLISKSSKNIKYLVRVPQHPKNNCIKIIQNTTLR